MLLVIGPSSSGKSTFINSSAISELGYVKSDEPFQMVKKGGLKKGKPIPPNAVMHWNYFSGATRLEGLARLEDESAGQIDKAVVIVAPVAELQQRATVRTTGEKDKGEYNSEHWLTKIKDTDFFQSYEDLFDYFDSRGIKYDVVYSSKECPGRFIKSDRVFVHHNLRGIYFDVPTPAEVEQELNLGRIPYQDAVLPNGMKPSKKNRTRQGTFRQIFTSSLAGQSVLDIGCAIGEFLFAAERRGGEGLVGVEADSGRYEVATKVGKLNKSAVTFHNMSFQDFESEAKFDYVLLLNVIHHIADFRSMLLKAASLTKGRLVVEFPTLNDRKFRSITDFDPASIPADVPLVGVSSKKVGQRFVFTPASIKRLCMEETGLFASCETFESPKADRLIMVFDRPSKDAVAGDQAKPSRDPNRPSKEERQRKKKLRAERRAAQGESQQGLGD